MGSTPPLTLVNASFVGGCAATIVSGALLPGVSVSPLVRLIVRMTPDSAFEYVTPETVQVSLPALIWHESVPPSTPVPVLSESVTTVSVATFCCNPVKSCVCTTTGNGAFTDGLKPALTAVIARRHPGEEPVPMTA